MAKVRDIQLRAQAIALAKEGYSYSIIAEKLNRSKWWVTKWVGRNRDDELLVDKPLNGRPKVLSNVAKKLIRNVKYKRGHGVRQPAFNDSVIQRMLFSAPNMDCFNRMVQNVTRQSRRFVG